MSLHDRYYRDDGRLQALDRYLTDLGDRIGSFWFARTGISRAVLTQGLFLLSAWASLQRLLFLQDLYATWFIALALFGLTGLSPSRGGVVEQMQMEVIRLPRNTLTFFRILLLAMGLFGLAQATGMVIASILAEGFPAVSIGDQLLTGVALTALQAGEYIRRTNPPVRSNGGTWAS